MSAAVPPAVPLSLGLALALSLGAASPALTQPEERPAAHASHDRHAPPAPGRRWATDAPLRDGMSGLRADMAVLAEAAPSQLAEAIDARLDFIIRNCRLPPDADAQLHRVIEGLTEASDRLRAGDGEGGRAEAAAALGLYGELFDHPGWRAEAEVGAGPTPLR